MSKDLHEGFTKGYITVVNPFATPRHDLLNTLLNGRPPRLTPPRIDPEMTSTYLLI